jgi:hypothetical protein
VPARDRSHYTGTYDTRAKRVRDAAYSDPSTRCWRCGLTLAEVPGATWHAGHTVDGNSNFPLAPEHSTCNTAAGAKAGHRRKALNPSRRWY